MPFGHPTLAAGPGTAGLDAAVRAFFDVRDASGDADVTLTSGVPDAATAHIILDGPLTDEVDAWDAEVPAQTVSGALWLVPGQSQPDTAAIAWLLLRLRTPATPLSDLTDAQDRALRWSVVGATTVESAPAEVPAVDPEDVKAWVDALPAVTDLGAAVDRIDGETAESVLAGVERFRSALQSAGTVPDLSAFDAAVAEHLRQVQRSGFGRWRGAKARVASGEVLRETAREAAAGTVRSLLAAREEEVRAEAAATLQIQDRKELHAGLTEAMAGLTLPADPDFSKVPRSWSTGAPEPRRYVFVAEEALGDLPDLPDVSVRGCPEVPTGTAVCAIVQSGFSLPAIRA